MLILFKISSHAIYQYPAFSESWALPTLLLIINALIILFIWSVFIRYYHHSLPKKLLAFLTNQENSKDPKNNKNKKTKQGKQAKTIQALSEKIEHYYAEKNMMLTALSHDIKTPLTEAILQLEILENPEIVDIADSIKEKLMRINSIINTSLEYSKEPDKVQKENKDIIPMLLMLCENYQQFGFPVTLISDYKNLVWPVEASLFQRMIRNILDNARRHGTHASIGLTQDQDSLIIEISDDGPGVPKEAIEKLSTPYFRVDPSRSRQTGGTGLGLSIVKKIAEIHQGTMVLSNIQPHGFRVRIKLKKLKN